MDQEIMTTALRREAAKALSHAAYILEYQNAGIDQVRQQVERALTALEMSLPTVGTVATITQRRSA